MLTGPDFQISGNKIITKTIFDAESVSQLKAFSLNIASTNTAGKSLTSSFTVTDKNIKEAPTDIKLCSLSGCAANGSLGDDTAVNSPIGNLSFVTADFGTPVTCTVYPDSIFGLVPKIITPTGISSSMRIVLFSSISFSSTPIAQISAACKVTDEQNIDRLSTTPGYTSITVLDEPKAPQPPILVANEPISEVVTKSNCCWYYLCYKSFGDRC